MKKTIGVKNMEKSIDARTKNYIVAATGGVPR